MNTGNQWGMAWYGAEGEAERESEIAEEDGVTKDRRENQRRRGGILDRNTGIKQEQVLMSIWCHFSRVHERGGWPAVASGLTLPLTDRKHEKKTRLPSLQWWIKLIKGTVLKNRQSHLEFVKNWANLFCRKWWKSSVSVFLFWIISESDEGLADLGSEQGWRNARKLGKKEVTWGRTFKSVQCTFWG